MLTVDIHEQLTDLPEHCRRRRSAVYPRRAFALGGYLAHENKFAVLGGKTKLRQLRLHAVGNIVEQRGNNRLRRPAADDILVSPAAEHRVDTADDDALARAGLAGENVERAAEFHGGFFYNCKVFNRKFS